MGERLRSPSTSAGSLQNVNITEYLSKAVSPTNPVDVQVDGTVDILDRTSRLLGIIYGNQGQLLQDATNKNAIVTGNPGTVLATDLGRLQPWYQPNAIRVLKTLAATVSPQNGTVEWTYTVPASRIAQVTGLFILLNRITAPTILGEAFMRIDDGANNLYVRDAIYDSSIGTLKIVETSGPYLFAGDKLRAVYTDSSVGGKVLFAVTAYILEFNA